MTQETNDRTDRTNRTTDRRTIGEIDHTNPYTGETAGQLFSRGPIVVTDGGDPNSTTRATTDGDADVDVDTESEEPTTDSTDRPGEDGSMKSVDHTPPNQAEDANAVFERGSEHEQATVTPEDEE
ncbi:hypothetical protein GS429_08200 [Natronorubrum sp. JWXQ-INN-674]|uniref:Uncharacterized protein n=1 Tax=Natronorubrum halalkaliphilum TaxID=2691917 RepID=A0A6B0VJN7_9EURY|nr:hypothetical protein [Natronorubrum halalkaliphilum]MXV62041.1 hypothetical protein [Natronorubrum halalkaliphilum]